MNALATSAPRPLPLASAVTGLAALALALLLGRDASPVPSVALGAASVVLLGAELARRTRALLRDGLGLQLALLALGACVVVAAWSVVAALGLGYVGLASALGLAGTALVMLAILRIAAVVGDGSSPWQALAGGPTPAAAARARFGRLAPLLVGALALLVALRLLVLGATGAVDGDASAGIALAVATVLLSAAGIGWAVRRLLGRIGAAQRRPPVDRDAQVVAAHLHDSVLQTLALIGRSTDDPARMAQLARRQERGLRAWLAGQDPAAATSLAGAVTRAAQEVEDEQAGVAIDVLTVGDAPADAATAAMADAAREAMRNAARHAGGPVEVLVEVAADGTRRVFVRDDGPGFDPAAVPAERRGVRDAIIGRMQHVGGTAVIDSGLAGTEITLVSPPSGEALPR